MKLNEIWPMKKSKYRTSPIKSVEKIAEDAPIAWNYYKNNGKNLPIYRGYGELSHHVGKERNILHGNSMMHKPRKASSMSSQIFTNMINLSSSWNGYPDRFRSWICATDMRTAATYGTSIYMVFPVGDPNIAVCENNDYWGSFRGLTIYISPSQFGDFLAIICRIANVNLQDVSTGHVNLTRKDIKRCMEIYETEVENFMQETDWYRSRRQFMEWYVESNLDNFIDYFSVLFSPQQHSFKLMKLSNYLNDKSITNGRHEVWFSGEAYLLNTMYSSLELDLDVWKWK